MFDAAVYSNRRAVLCSRVGSGCILVPGNDLVGMNYRDNPYAFRQDGTFVYCTGMDVPGLCLWLDCDSGEEVLFGADPGLMHTVWSGPTPSLAELAICGGIARTGSMEELARTCQAVLAQGRVLHYPPPYRGDGTLLLSRLTGRHPDQIHAGSSQALIKAVVALRSVKSSAEVDEIRRAVDLSAETYELLLDACSPDVAEMELCGRVVGHILARGGREAFPTILTCRGEVLHNHCHDQVLRGGDLLLVDSGVLSPLGYASDITRTLPVAGRFTTRQREIYEIVLAAQAAGLAGIAPGQAFVDCHQAAALAVATGLTELGFMRGDPVEAVAVGAHALFFPHGLGHMLGLDAHDMEGLGEDNVGYGREYARSSQFGLSGLRLARRLESGFVLTVEPGIYFIPDLIRQWRVRARHAAFINYQALEACLDFGGIRIEDDVLVTVDGYEVLSAAIPKSVRGIEDRMERAG